MSRSYRHFLLFHGANIGKNSRCDDKKIWNHLFRRKIKTILKQKQNWDSLIFPNLT